MCNVSVLDYEDLNDVKDRDRHKIVEFVEIILYLGHHGAVQLSSV